MNNVNKTLYIPLYGKAYVSCKNIILSDKSAENIWSKEGFKLNGKSKSKWLAYYMGMRARVFDDWTSERIKENPKAIVIHVGCGLDSRAERVDARGEAWFDLDFPEVIEERRKYFSENESYRMIGADIRESGCLDFASQDRSAIVIMEGVSMYLTPEELKGFFATLSNRFDKLTILMDCYTTFAARASKIKNPINDVGVTTVYGMDDPTLPLPSDIRFIGEHEMTPVHLIDELKGIEKSIFSKVYGGKMSNKLYKLYEYSK